MDGTIEAAFHPFFSIATGRDVTRCLAWRQSEFANQRGVDSSTFRGSIQEVGATEKESQPIGESRVRHGEQSAAVPDYVQQDIVQHKDWIESCTDLPVLVVDQDLILYYINVERGHEEIIQCLLSKVSRVIEACGADGGTIAMYLPPFPNS